MKKRVSAFLVSLFAAIGVISFGAASQSKNQVQEASAYYTPGTHYEVSDTASELASYYSSISDSDTGTSLLSKLQSLNSSKRKKTMGYSTIGTDTSGAVIYTDYDLNSTAKDSNGQTYGTKVASFYTKTAATSWNREHMWPNSHGGNNVEADILHTRPTISSENSSRGNSFYVEGKNSSSAGWDPYTAGYDIECRGECARVILYCVVAYPDFTLSDADSHSTSNNNKDNMMGNMNTLIKWHFDHAPNVYEMNRNNGAEYLQGNRNPFVDHPEYVARIWSSFNSTVSSLCSSNASKYSSWTPGNYCDYGSNTPVNNNGVTISASSASVSVGSTTTLSATASNSGTITWTTSNSSVVSISSSSSASGSSITITGVAAGTATITAKATISGTQYSSTCTVTVTKVVSSLSKGSTSPTKTTYTAGESFDSTGLTITANYSDSSSGDVTSSVVWTPNPLTAGTTSVTGTFGGKTIVITGITVNAASEPEIIDSNSDLSVGDYVVLRTAAGVGVTGWNNNKDATVSETESEWKRFYVASASSSGFTLKDESANSFIASPGSSNQFLYGTAATCSTDSDGHLICNSRYLCKNGTNYRFYGSISSYLPFFIYKVPASSAKTLSSISVSTAPTKTTYTAGESFDPTGLVITRNYSDSTSDTYTYSGHTSEFTFSPSTSAALTTSDVSVTITYSGKSTSQAITVNAATKTLSSISIEGQKTSFTVDEAFSFGGTVTAHFSDSSTSDVTASATYSGYNMSVAGNYTVTVSYTYGSATKTTTYSITVATSGGGESDSFSGTYNYGNQGTGTGKTWSLTDSSDQSSYWLCPVDTDESIATIPGIFTNKTITSSVVITINSGTYSNGNNPSSSTFKIYTSSACTSEVTATQTGTLPTSKTYTDAIYTVSLANASNFSDDLAIKITKPGKQIRLVSINVEFDYTTAGSSSPTLSSIAIATAPTKTTYTAGEYFDPTGLVITRNYSDSTSDTYTYGGHTSEFSFSPSTSTALTTSDVSVTITFDGKSTSQTITVNSAAITSISATVSKTYYVGETISSSDITVKDNNNNTIEGFLFANDNYKFTYSDASSGGSLTNKTFTNSITYSSYSCSLTVQVQRKARESVGSVDDELNRAFTGISGTNYSDWSGKDGPNSSAIYAGNSAGGNESIQLRSSNSNSGIVSTTSGGTLTKVTVTWNSNTTSGRTLNVYGKNLAYSSASDLYNSDNQGTLLGTIVYGTSTELTISDSYAYVGVRSASGAIYLTDITFTYGSEDSATNVANYIMYEDTDNQCLTKFTTAKGYFEGLTSTERNTFMTSSDYVISTARKRLEAWARHQGKTINNVDGDYSISNISRIPVILNNSINNTTIIVVVTVGIAAIAIGGYFLLRKKKED